MRNLAIALFTILTLASWSNSNGSEPRNPKQAARIEARAERTAKQVKYIDSLVQTRNFYFIPSSIQRQPAGNYHMITSALYALGIHPGYVDIHIPFIKGITPPYRYTVINTTAPLTNSYIFKQTSNGWLIDFSTSVFAVNNMRFSLSIYSAAGSATLNIYTDMFNTVTYTGMLQENY